jgi:hypothetical protein
MGASSSIQLLTLSLFSPFSEDSFSREQDLQLQISTLILQLPSLLGCEMSDFRPTHRTDSNIISERSWKLVGISSGNWLLWRKQ